MDNQGQICPDPNDRLESWKEIAVYLNKGVRTVIRWEKTEGLPVHRHQHQRKASVFAYRTEIDAWWRSRHPDAQEGRPPEPSPRPAVRRSRFGILAAVTAGSILLFWAWQVQVRSEMRLSLRGQPLTSYPGQQFSPSFSPDGVHFAFAWNGVPADNVDIYVQAVGSAEPRRFTEHPHVDFSPAWSPDGEWLAFLRRSPAFEVSIFLAPARGGGERKLVDLHVPHYMDGTQLSWSPDSRWLTVADTVNGHHGLFLIELRTGAMRRLTTSPTRRGHLDPAFSPDGRHIAFRCGNVEEYAQICLMPLTADYLPAGPPQTLTPKGLRATSPVWTADGRSLIYSSGLMESDSSLYRLQVFPEAARTKPPRQITAAGENQFSLGISHHANLLAFTRKVTDVNIWAVRREGEQWQPPRSLPEISSSGRDISPDYSPDGTHIAFASDRTGNMEIWVAASDGSRPRPITSMGTEPAHSPRWSPDGRSIVFATGNRVDGSIYITGLPGGTPRRLTQNACCPSWSRDGRTLYFHRDRGTAYLVMKIPAAGGTPVPVGGLESSNEFLVDSGPLESPDGQSLHYRQSDSIWRVPLQGGQPERVVQVAGCQSWVVRKEGLYTIGVFSTGVAGRNPILFHPARGGPPIEIAATASRSEPGLSVSPDGNSVLFSQTDYVRTNLMFLRDF